MTTTLQSASMQLRNCGAQDHILYDNPESSLFATCNKRITPYAVSNQSIIFTEPFDFGRTVTASFPSTADLLNKLYFYVKLPKLPLAPGSTYTSWTQTVGFAMVEWVELLFGNVRIAMCTSESMEIESYQSTGADHVLAMNKMIGRMTQISSLGQTQLEDVYIPIPFHFTKGLETSLPLFMLDKQRVSIRMKVRPFHELVTYDGPVMPPLMKPINGYLLADFVLMSPDEKRLWLSKPYALEFEQWQTHVVVDLPENGQYARIPLTFSNCVKEISWVLREHASQENNDWFNYACRDGQPGAELMRSASIVFDGKERFPKMPESYYRLINPRSFRTTAGDRNIYMVSFADRPELTQNTGTANLSRFDDVQLHMELIPRNPPLTVIALAKSYNTLIIENGIASLRFSV